MSDRCVNIFMISICICDALIVVSFGVFSKAGIRQYCFIIYDYLFLENNAYWTCKLSIIIKLYLGAVQMFSYLGRENKSGTFSKTILKNFSRTNMQFDFQG